MSKFEERVYTVFKVVLKYLAIIACTFIVSAHKLYTFKVTFFFSFKSLDLKFYKVMEIFYNLESVKASTSLETWYGGVSERCDRRSLVPSC